MNQICTPTFHFMGGSIILVYLIFHESCLKRLSYYFLSLSLLRSQLEVVTKSGTSFVFPILLVITLTPGDGVHISGWTVCSPGCHVSAALFSQFPLLPVSFSKVRISLKIIVENGRLHERYRRSEDTLGEGKLETLAE